MRLLSVRCLLKSQSLKTLFWHLYRFVVTFWPYVSNQVLFVKFPVVFGLLYILLSSPLQYFAFLPLQKMRVQLFLTLLALLLHIE